MKINFDQILVDLSEKDLIDSEKKVLTLKKVATDALLAANPNEQGVSGEDKAKRYELAVRLVKGGEQEISVEEAVLLKELIGKAYSPIVVGQVYKIIA